jgi:hypothetical protein
MYYNTDQDGQMLAKHVIKAPPSRKSDAHISSSLDSEFQVTVQNLASRGHDNTNPVPERSDSPIEDSDMELFMCHQPKPPGPVQLPPNGRDKPQWISSGHLQRTTGTGIDTLKQQHETSTTPPGGVLTTIPPPREVTPLISALIEDDYL